VRSLDVAEDEFEAVTKIDKERLDILLDILNGDDHISELLNECSDD
jgi:hypothetical protein